MKIETNNKYLKPRPRCSLTKVLIGAVTVISAFAGNYFRGAYDEARPNPTTLWFVAQKDPNGALSRDHINFEPFHRNGRRLQYEQTGDFDELCRTIEQAGENNFVDLVVIQGHATPSSITLSDKSEISFFNDFASCFRKTDQTAQIVLLGCHAGLGENSIASVISNQSRRRVIAPSELFYSKMLRFEENKIRMQKPDSEDVARVFEPSGSLLSRDQLIEIARVHRSQAEADEIAIDFANQNKWEKLDHWINFFPISKIGLEQIVKKAAQIGQPEVLKVVLKSDSISRYMRGTVLMEAASQGHKECVNLLLANGPISDLHLNAALIHAVENQFFDIAKSMLQQRQFSKEAIAWAQLHSPKE